MMLCEAAASLLQVQANSKCEASGSCSMTLSKSSVGRSTIEHLASILCSFEFKAGMLKQTVGCRGKLRIAQKFIYCCCSEMLPNSGTCPTLRAAVSVLPTTMTAKAGTMCNTFVFKAYSVPTLRL